MHIDVDGDATVDEAASLVPGATEQLDVFRRLVEVTNARRPALSTVLARRPFDVIDSAVAWDRLLDVVEWLAENPNPQRYLRQIDLPGVHTKLIEEHARLLSLLCGAACPSAVVDPDAVTFERRFGFRTKPRLVRFRVLDPSLLLSSPRFPRVPAGDLHLGRRIGPRAPGSRPLAGAASCHLLG